MPRRKSGLFDSLASAPWEKLALTPHRLVLVRLCHDLEANHMRATAKRTGAPTPSASVVRLPDYGTEFSVSAGLACMGGRAMRRLPNGWEQLVDASGRWQRCETLE